MLQIAFHADDHYSNKTCARLRNILHIKRNLVYFWIASQFSHQTKRGQ